MQWPLFVIKVLQTFAIVTILSLFLVPQPLKTNVKSGLQNLRIRPQSVFCKVKLKQSDKSAANDTELNKLLALDGGRKGSAELMSVASCRHDGISECFCLNQFYTVAINVASAALVALFTVLAVLLVCIMWSKKMSRSHALCSYLTSVVALVGSLTIGLFDIYFFTSG